jgi:hypothetical protein
MAASSLKEVECANKVIGGMHSLPTLAKRLSDNLVNSSLDLI